MQATANTSNVRTPRDGDSRTKRVLNLISRRNGATIREVVTELNKTPGRKPVDERTARGWLAPSFLVAFGVKAEAIDTPRGTRFRAVPVKKGARRSKQKARAAA